VLNSQYQSAGQKSCHRAFRSIGICRTSPSMLVLTPASLEMSTKCEAWLAKHSKMYWKLSECSYFKQLLIFMFLCYIANNLHAITSRSTSVLHCWPYSLCMDMFPCETCIEKETKWLLQNYNAYMSLLPYFPDYKSHLNISRTPYFCIKFGKNS